ncbi:putative membrane associated protein [Granulibacter bethesdensis]|uniref:Membrane associated protein n=2 Tax=Granulibacter bethesdensis TaxID=364410 RepID=A0AAN0VF57_9PROT|nr:putative membrane associated protein [Granulibacter bethesdensis]
MPAQGDDAMIRPITCICMLAASISGLYLYQTKHRTRMLDRQITEIERDTRQVRARIDTLKAEWALLNTPDRLNELATRYLNLKPTAPTQFASLADLNARLPAVVPPGSQPATPPDLLPPESDLQVPSGPTVAPTAVPMARLDRTPHPQMARNTMEPAEPGHTQPHKDASGIAPRGMASLSAPAYAGDDMDSTVTREANQDTASKAASHDGAKLKLTATTHPRMPRTVTASVGTGFGSSPAQPSARPAMAAPKPVLLQTAAHGTPHNTGGYQAKSALSGNLVVARAAPVASAAPLMASALGMNRGSSLPPPVPVGGGY